MPMMDRIKVTISQEDGKPVCPGASEPETMFLTDESPFLIVRKDGGTVETFAGSIGGLLEFTIRQLEGLEVLQRQQFCEAFGLKFQHSQKN